METTQTELARLLQRQIDALFMITEDERSWVSEAMDAALRRAHHCFAHTDNKYYRRHGAVQFNPFHSGQYSIFLYFASNEIFRADPVRRQLADKVYYLNKALNGLDLFYEVEMPDIFFLDHPVGSVIGRAKIGERFTFAQNCTVGNNKGAYPTIGRNVTMMSGAKIVGSCRIGDNVICAGNSYVKDLDVPANSIVFGQSPDNTIKPRRDL